MPFLVPRRNQKDTQSLRYKSNAVYGHTYIKAPNHGPSLWVEPTMPEGSVVIGVVEGRTP